MPSGDKSKYTDKQKRQAEHIEEGYENRGTPEKTAERIAWATVNKESGGGKKSGSGRRKATSKTSTKQVGHKSRKPAVRSRSSSTTSSKVSKKSSTAG
jgi:plasmid stabilization system protein ParE